MTVRLFTGDCLGLMPTLSDGVADAIVTDPPYGIKFMGKAWDHGIPGVPFWRAAFHTMKPGAYLLAFGGTRTYHRLACAIEDAGFELHDTISWLYGSGFPKHKSKLKPAWEPITLARRPAKKATDLNIDACRIEGEKGVPASLSNRGSYPGWTTGGDMERKAVQNGRWPANVVLDEEAAAQLDEQSGTLTSNSGNLTHRNGVHGSVYGAPVPGPTRGISDSGGASRFYYCAKASRAERNAGLAGSPLHRKGQHDGDRANDDIGFNREKFVENHHPTVKPIALMRWLCRLVTPAGGTVLDPFMGSGSTGIAARLEWLDFIGIDERPDYVEIARARIAHHEQKAEAVEMCAVPHPSTHPKSK